MVVIRDASTAASRTVLLVNCVVIFLPLMLTVAEGRKLFPLILSVNAGPPFATKDGEMDPNKGAGVRILNFSSLETPPPGGGLVTETGTSPGTNNCSAGISALMSSLLSNTDLNCPGPKRVCDSFRNFSPKMVSGNPASPALHFWGTSLLIMGTGFSSWTIMRLWLCATSTRFRVASRYRGPI